MTAPALDIRDLAIELPVGSDRARAVSGVNLTVAKGEIVCLVGESGSGKSVIAHATMGLLPPALRVGAGEIIVAGENVVTASEARLRALRCTRMAMIFQEPMTALNPVMTCGDQIDEVLTTHTVLGPDERRAKILAMLADVRLAEPGRMMASYPHQLSGGQRQRIMIAMALILDPALLIADEPTTALDVTTQAQILSLVRDLMREHGTGVLFITHDFGVVAELADRVAVLRLGELVELGSRADVLSRPKHPYTRMLIASVPGLEPRHREDVADRTVLKAERLTKVYSQGGWLSRRRDVAAATDVSFEVRRGETLGIVGESGSGKSTVARCIARLIEPSAGHIAIQPEERFQTAFVFQDAHLLPWRTVLDNAALPLELMGVPQAERYATARAALQQVNLFEAEDRYPAQLSGGMRMRVSLARALVTQPRLLLLDEPFAALDEITRFRLDIQLRELWRTRGITVIFVTHSISEAAFLANRAVVLTKRGGGIKLDRRLDLPAERNDELRMDPRLGREMQALLGAMEEES